MLQINQASRKPSLRATVFYRNAQKWYALQDFREPLYLTDTAVQLEDTRSAESAFRHKLKGDHSLYFPLPVCHCKAYSPVAIAQPALMCIAETDTRQHESQWIIWFLLAHCAKSDHAQQLAVLSVRKEGFPDIFGH
jgi:hypothetical protein